MNLNDIKKLSCSDLNWIKNIESCGPLELPKRMKYDSGSVQFLMHEHEAMSRGRNDFTGRLSNYEIAIYVSVSLQLSKCNSIIISSEHWGNWN